MSRRLALLFLAVVAATGLLATPTGTPEVRAATPDLTIVGNARYDVQPDAHRVRVTVDMVMTNHLHDTTTKRYYFDRPRLGQLYMTIFAHVVSDVYGIPLITDKSDIHNFSMLTPFP